MNRERRRSYFVGVTTGDNAGRISIEVAPDDMAAPVKRSKCWIGIGGGESSEPLPPDEAIPWLQLFLFQEAAERLIEAADKANDAASSFADVAATVRQVLNRLRFWGRR
jgi:hypothetical protein